MDRPTRLNVSVLVGTSASVALAVTANALNSSSVWFPGTVNTGATFTSRTVTVKLLVALKAGTPLSVTTTVIVFVLGPCASFGVQLIAPLLPLIVIPVGDPTRLNVSVLVGTSASVALAVTASALNSSSVWFPGTVNTGATFTSRTVTVKLLVALKAGTPLSVTTTVIVFVLGPCASFGVQLIAPLLPLIVIPVGDPTRLNVSVLVGTSASVALAVTASALNSSSVWFPGTVNTGATFTSRTVTVKLLVALKAGTPLSVTTTVIVFVLGPCASFGVQLIAPLLPLIVIPTGGPTRLNVSVLVGTSASVALAVTANALSSSSVWFPGTVNTGATFTSRTVTVKLFVALKAGTPLSVTTTVIVFVLGPCASFGVQLIAPLLPLLVIPTGGPTRLTVSVLVGTSASVALAVTASALNSSSVWFPGTVNTGAVFVPTTLTATSSTARVYAV